MVEKKEINFPRYEHYKDSGIEWIGEIPAHWDTLKMQYLFRDVSIKNRANAELLSVTQNQGVVPRSWVENRMVMPSGNLESFKYIEKGDFAISLRSFEGGLEHCYADGIISPAYTVLKCNPEWVQAGYFKYLFKSYSFISELQLSVVGIREGRNVSYSLLSQSIMPIPPIVEQTAIAQFLDHKTAQIDRAIAIKEAQIKLLNERKQIMIQEAVTKGLDPSVPMKDSGIEWIGEIPAHWDVKLLRHIGFTQNGVSEGAEYFGLGHPFVSYGDVYNDFQLPSSVKGLANSSELDRRLYSVQIGDVFFTRTSETIDEIGISSTCLQTIPNAVFSGFLIRFRPTKKELDEGFSSYYFSTTFVRNFFTSELNLVTRVSLSQGLLKKLPVLLPPKSEQKTIFNFLENQKEKINMAINVYESQIQTLKEYKTTLINEAVTGKIKVY